MSMHWQHFSCSPASQQQTHKLARLSPYSKHPTATDPSQNPVLPRHHAGLQMDNQQIFHQPRLIRERHRRHSATLLQLVSLLPHCAFKILPGLLIELAFLSGVCPQLLYLDGDPAGIVGSEFLPSAQLLFDPRPTGGEPLSSVERF
jgi:hypothetical protein